MKIESRLFRTQETSGVAKCLEKLIGQLIV